MTVVLDTSVLVNFLRIDRMDLVARHSHGFTVTDHVAAEITTAYPEQRARLAAARGDGVVQEARITDPAEVALFGSLAASSGLGRRDRPRHASGAHAGD